MHGKRAGTHATIGWGGGKKDCCDLVVRLTIVGERYVTRDTVEAVMNYRRVKESTRELQGEDYAIIELMAKNLDTDPDDMPEIGLGELPDEHTADDEVNLLERNDRMEMLAIKLKQMWMIPDFQKIKESNKEPEIKYRHTPTAWDDVLHHRFYNVIFAMMWDASLNGFVPFKERKNPTYGYISYWSEYELTKLNLGQFERKAGLHAREFVESLRKHAFALSEFRSTVKDLSTVSSYPIHIGERKYKVIPEVTRLKRAPVITAAALFYGETVEEFQRSDNLNARMATFMGKYMGTTVPESWLLLRQDEHEAGFKLNMDVLPAIVRPGQLSEKLLFRQFPEAMSTIDPWHNCVDEWTS